MTPTLSVGAVQETVTDVAVEPLWWRFVGVEGGVVSAGHALVAIVVLVCAEWLPAES